MPTDPLRARILTTLRAGGELATADVAAAAGLPVPDAARVLRALRADGVVRSKTDGRRNFYRIGPAAAERVCPGGR